MTIQIRPAVPSDAAQILTFITELAEYEKARHEVIASVVDIERSLFSEGATAHGLICSRDDVPIGFAVFFFSYSTWLGSNCLYLEDLYINPEQRGGGAGKKLLRHLAKIAFDLSGACWTGTSRRLPSTNPSAPSRRRSGCAIAWRVMRCATLHWANPLSSNTEDQLWEGACP
ncbi:hypothetical protein ALQ29_03495, partial [Pseudomonas marginalis pv. marginalis]